MTDDSIDSRARVCAVCGRVLVQYVSDGGRVVHYVHEWLDKNADHPPVPVRAGEVPDQVRYRCDICLNEPITHTLVVDKELGIDAINVRWDTEWAMCRACTDLVIADDWLNLRRRAFAEADRIHGSPLSEETKLEMRVVYRDLRQHMMFIYEEPEPAI